MVPLEAARPESACLHLFFWLYSYAAPERLRPTALAGVGAHWLPPWASVDLLLYHNINSCIVVHFLLLIIVLLISF